MHTGKEQPWACPECGAGVEELLYAEDTSTYFYIEQVKDGIAQIGRPQGSDYSAPSNMRLFCTACSTYFYDAGDMSFVDTLKVEY